MINTLLCLMVVASLLQPSAQRLACGAVLSVLTLAHYHVFYDADGFAYYYSAAATELLIIAALALITPVSKMAVRLQVICTVSIVWNLGGWLIWRAYLPPNLYNMGCGALYLWSLITLIRRGQADVGGPTIFRPGASFRLAPRPCHILDIKNGGTV